MSGGGLVLRVGSAEVPVADLAEAARLYAGLAARAGIAPADLPLGRVEGGGRVWHLAPAAPGEAIGRGAA